MSMKQSTEYIFQKYRDKHAFMRELEAPLRETAALLVAAYRGGGKLLVCGNGGSSADADHIVGELMKAFRIRRPLDEKLSRELSANGASQLAEMLEGSLPAINLSAHTALVTAQSNDVGADYIYAQQVIGYGRPGDVLLGISTSGNSRNILYAGEAARAKGMKTVAMTGRDGGKMKENFDILLCAPEDNTEDIQDVHSTLYHILCAVLENEFWGE